MPKPWFGSNWVPFAAGMLVGILLVGLASHFARFEKWLRPECEFSIPR